MKFPAFLLSLLFVLSCSMVSAQDLLSMVDDGNTKTHDLTIATFKTTRLINFHTIETVGPRTLDFRISNRFGAINSKGYNAWGIDGPVNIRLSLEYSPDGRFMFGVGRSSYQKMVDGFLKWKLMRQRDDNSMPMTVTLFAGMYRNALKNQIVNGFDYFEHESSRLSYNFQILIGRKFSPSFSFQVATWYVHYNMVTAIPDKNDMYGISGLFRFKFSARSAITAEYPYRMNKDTNAKNYDSMGIGYEIENGGHVFQVHLTNSFGLDENQFLPFTDSKWNDAGIRLGFNVSRVFTL